MQFTVHKDKCHVRHSESTSSIKRTQEYKWQHTRKKHDGPRGPVNLLHQFDFGCVNVSMLKGLFNVQNGPLLWIEISSAAVVLIATFQMELAPLRYCDTFL